MFKKGSPNGKITVYLGRRDFVDHISHVDPIGEGEIREGRREIGIPLVQPARASSFSTSLSKNERVNFSHPSIHVRL